MYGYVYLTTNLINNKKYVGLHKSSKFDTSYKGSGKTLKKAFEKYGIQNFETIILETYDSEEDLHNGEIFWIEKLNAVNSKDFYNIKQGGFGGYHINGVSIKKGKKVSEIGRENISKAHKGKKYTEKQKLAHKGLFSKEKNPNWGKSPSKEVRDKWSSIRKNRVWVNNGSYERPIDLEYLESYLNNGFKRGRIKSSVINAANVYKSIKWCWVTNGSKDKKIKKDDLEKYLNNGYKHGRTFGVRGATTIESVTNKKDISE